jgi:hypothetical protein
MFGITLLEFGTLWFWSAAFLPFFILIALVENEKSGWAAFTTAATIAALISFGNMGWLSWIAKHPLLLVAYIIGYLVVGIGWGVAKWGFYAAHMLADYEAFRRKWIEKNGLIRDEALPKEQLQYGKGTQDTHGSKTWRDRFISEASQARVGAPNLAANSTRIIFWMSYWPASAVWTLLHDPITHLYRLIYARMINVFNGITTMMFGKYNSDFVAAEVKAPETGA